MRKQVSGNTDTATAIRDLSDSSPKVEFSWTERWHLGHGEKESISYSTQATSPHGNLRCKQQTHLSVTAEDRSYGQCKLFMHNDAIQCKQCNARLHRMQKGRNAGPCLCMYKLKAKFGGKGVGRGGRSGWWGWGWWGSVCLDDAKIFWNLP